MLYFLISVICILGSHALAQAQSGRHSSPISPRWNPWPHSPRSFSWLSKWKGVASICSHYSKCLIISFEALVHTLANYMSNYDILPLLLLIIHESLLSTASSVSWVQGKAMSYSSLHFPWPVVIHIKYIFNTYIFANLNSNCLAVPMMYQVLNQV